MQPDLFGNAIRPPGRKLRAKRKRATRFHLSIDDPEIQCKVVRGVLIQRLDDAFYSSIQPRLTEELQRVVLAAMTKDDRDIRQAVNGFVLRTFQEVQAALFAEEFEDEMEPAELERRKGLIPRGGEGVERVGEKAWSAFAKRVYKVAAH